MNKVPYPTETYDDVEREWNRLVRAESLTTDEYNELLHLTDQIENMEAHRMEYLAELARLRRTSLTKLPV